MNSAVNYIYDEATAFRKPTDAAITASADSTAIALDRMTNHTGAYADKLGNQVYTVVLVVTALDTGTGDETYAVQVETDGGAAVSQAVTVTAVGTHVFHIDRDTIDLADSDAASLNIAATLGGTTPSLSYYAWMV